MSDGLGLDLLRVAFAQLPDPIFILNEDGKYVDCLGAADGQIYLNGDKLRGHYLRDVAPPEFHDFVMTHIQAALARAAKGDLSPLVVEYVLDSADMAGLDPSIGPKGPQNFEGKVSALPYLVEGRRVVIWITRNVTEQMRQRDEITHQAHHDDLTGLLNRRAFLGCLASICDDGGQNGLLLIDIDKFKDINDQMGHATGDRVLQQFGEFLKTRLRRRDHLSRLGGDEFAILVADTKCTELTSIAGRLVAESAAHVFGDPDRPIRLTISVGATMLSENADHNATMMRADSQLYAAKNQGRNSVSFCHIHH
ncbi:sensor domain-containing diguanylate cyclase [Paracoccus sp. (in: a-proteobacteria)]|uniref:sensor domain-containing diguanylate cyclase n=1 Tax=Paracoccus sp. TaxID=267 RepID=UPI0026DEC640|nr:sensor domain-containing diguanylate cyclase [Paracoccus sp. (in: a-proteobacteria)]MDO5648655.1 diguanylate cyclase [Paracoccus sp. (in: a-proteobacteria)]